jgi:hypothetical protein
LPWVVREQADVHISAFDFADGLMITIGYGNWLGNRINSIVIEALKEKFQMHRSNE